MDVLLLVVVLVGAAAGAVLLLRERYTWQEFHVEDGRGHVAGALYQELRRRGIRCRYRVGNSGALFSQDGAMSRIQEVRILVHRDDLHRAREVRTTFRERSR